MGKHRVVKETEYRMENNSANFTSLQSSNYKFKKENLCGIRRTITITVTNSALVDKRKPSSFEIEEFLKKMRQRATQA